MWKNYLTIALRHLRHNRSYAVLNIGGLAAGLATCLLIALWVRHETSYDTFHEHADRLYRVVIDVEGPGGEVSKFSNTQPVLGRTLAIEDGAPAVEEAIRFGYRSALFWSSPDRQFYEGREGRPYLLADPAALTVFSFPLRHGDPQTALDGPGRVVLSLEAAERYFPDTDNPVGQTITRGDGRVLAVTGVLEAIPQASQLRPALLVSIATDEGDEQPWQSWSSLGIKNYVLLREGATREAAEVQVNRLFETQAADGWAANGYAAKYTMEPLTSVHLRSEHGGPGADGSLANVRIFSLIALFILALACVNYTNLATAQSRRRVREIGVRRSVGAGRREVAVQFLVEAVVLALAGGLGALVLARLALPAFARLAGTQLPFLGGTDVLVLLGVAVGTGLLAGAYPALLLSGYRPSHVLRGSGSSSRQSTSLRRGLTTLQFAVAIGLIAATAVVFTQLRHMQRQDLGFQKDRMLVLNFGGDEDVRRRLETVKDRLRQLPAVEHVTASSDYPSGDTFHSGPAVLEGPDGAPRNFSVWMYDVDTSFASTYGMTLVAGQPMARAALPDSVHAVLLNEAAVRESGYDAPGNAVGRSTSIDGRSARVVGVVRDFHDAGLQRAIEPMALVEAPANAASLTLRLRADASVRATLPQVEQAWTEIAPERPFDYLFLDQAFAAQYRAERRFGRLFAAGAVLAILIACLGLFGLAAFAVEARTKEIGVRKVLGASASSIVALLSKDFLLLVAAGFAVAAPVTWWAMGRWLDGFAYSIELGPLVFLLAGATAMLVAALTVSTRAVRAASADPVESLRHE